MGRTDTESNVLLLLTDQERYDVSAPGGPAVRTPTMDRLQSEGRRETDDVLATWVAELLDSSEG